MDKPLNTRQELGTTDKRRTYEEDSWWKDREIMFYDVTTLYFEASPGPEADMRQAGFSKDGKSKEAQIVLGLLVSEDGYPFVIFSYLTEARCEGFTMIPCNRRFCQEVLPGRICCRCRRWSDELKKTLNCLNQPNTNMSSARE